MDSERIMFDLNDLARECQSIAASKGWNDRTRSFGDTLSLIHSELSEALEEYRNGAQIDEIYFTNGKPEGIPIELADVIIRILHFCGDHRIDIHNAVLQKMEYNKTRAYRHGGKTM